MWQLKSGARILATHKTRRQCVIEAYERGLVVYGRGKETLVDGVTIEEVRNDASDGKERNGS